jgi:uncharacterized membrane protein
MFNVLFTHTPLLYLVQSLWRDEAFSVLVGERSLGFIVAKLGFEPPVYYFLLHFWMKLFGQSEIAVRSLSFIGFALATCIVVEWSDQLFKKHWLARFTPLFFFLNPMLLYYAFEVRTYGWYMFFAVASLYAYVNKRWGWFAIASTLAFYTHTYYLVFIGTLGIHWLATDVIGHKFSLPSFIKSPPFKAFAGTVLVITPWLIKVIRESARLKSSWYFPVDMQLVRSVIGNMFIGYEGTPWYGWHFMPYLSAAIILFAGYLLWDRKNHRRNSTMLFYTFFPLVVTVGISFIKPLFVNRYVIPVTIGEVMVIVLAISAIRNQLVQKIVAAACLLFVVWVNWWYPPQHAKLPIRDTMQQINLMVKNNDVIYADNPIIYLETKYYAKDRTRAFLYNPQQGSFPWFIGDAIVDQSNMAVDYPMYPDRAFIVHADGTFDIFYRTAVAIKTTRVLRK